MTTRPMTIHEARVEILQVSIEVLKVGPKQVTMGLFRQLPYRDLVDFDALALEAIGEGDDEGQAEPVLRGHAWGYVNYVWDGFWRGDNNYTNNFGQLIAHGAKLHMVWEIQARLYRSLVYADVPLWVIQRYGHETSIRPHWRARYWSALAKLPQLFIAV